MTGNDFTLDINDPQRPKIVCLGNDPIRAEALSPVISPFCDQLNKVINQKDRMKCAVIYDEIRHNPLYVRSDGHPGRPVK